MHYCRLSLFAVLCAMALTTVADAQDCGGCLDSGCMDCGKYSSKRFQDPFCQHFCDRPPACLGTAELQFMALKRNGANSQAILFAGGNPVANVNDLEFDAEFAFRLDVFLPGANECDFNLNVLATDGAHESLIRSDPGITFRFYGAGPATPANAYLVEYQHGMTSVGLNARSRGWERFSPIVGIRFVELTEDFNILTPTNTGFFSDTDNDLYGIQVGGRALLLRRPRWWIESTLKAGVYYNDIRVEARAQNALLSRGFGHTAFVGDLQIVAVYQMSPRLQLRTGFQGLWFSGVAKAPDQSNAGSLISGLLPLDPGHVTYQGGYAGFEFTW